MRATVPWAGRQAFVSCPRCPDLLVPRHVRIDHMLELPRAPHGDQPQRGLPRDRGPSVRSGDLRSPQHDERGGAGRMCRGEQRRCRERADDATRTASRLPRSSSTAVMLSAHCSKVGSAPGVTGSDAPVPGWSKKMSRPSDVIASTHPWMRRQLRKMLAAGEPVRDEHDVARTLSGRAIGDAQVPVHRIARLREHGGSVSRGAGWDFVSRDQLKQSLLHAFVANSAAPASERTDSVLPLHGGSQSLGTSPRMQCVRG